MHRWRKYLKHFWHTLDRKRKIQLGALLLLLIAIPTTVYVAQTQQEIRQQASETENLLPLIVSPQTTTPGSIVTVSWGTPASPSATIDVTVDQQTVRRGDTITASWTYTTTQPQKNDFMRTFHTTYNSAVATYYFNSCGETASENIPTTTGKCPINTRDYIPGTYVIKIFSGNSATVLGATTFTVTDEAVSVPAPTQPVGGGALPVLVEQARCNGKPADFCAATFGAGSSCGPENVCTAPNSIAYRTLGEACDQRWWGTSIGYCKTGLVCGSNNTCMAQNSIPNGSSCQNNSECKSNSCLFGVAFTGVCTSSQSSATDIQTYCSQLANTRFVDHGTTGACMSSCNPALTWDDGKCVKVCPSGKTKIEYFVGNVCLPLTNTPSQGESSNRGSSHNSDNGFLFVPKAFAQTTLQGDETIQLFKAYSWDAAGRQIYLNCEEKTQETPSPTTVSSSGSCYYPISPGIPDGLYTFRMYTPDGKLIAESNPLTITTTLPSSTPAPTDTTPVISCRSDADCTNAGSDMRCFLYQPNANFEGICRPVGTQCAQVVTRACGQRHPDCSDPNRGCPAVYYPPECIDFPNSCVVPPGWEIQPSSGPRQACSGPNDTSCSTGLTCLQDCGGPGAQGEEEPGYFCATAEQVARRAQSPCPRCLSQHTLIATPQGDIAVQALTKGMIVWSVNHNGEKIAVKVSKVSRVTAPPTHMMVHMTLTDGRSLVVSPAHPTATGTHAGQLKKGDMYDGSLIQSVEKKHYQYSHTYDLLPDSETGFYYANGILMGSTLQAN